MTTNFKADIGPYKTYGKILKPIVLRDTLFRNRLWVPPMCQYSSPNGHPTAWHFQHYTTLALGSGCVIVEATAISKAARVTPQDLVLDSHAELSQFMSLAKRIADQGAVPGIQLCHGGRKASRTAPWDGDRALPPSAGGWDLISPSAIAFGKEYSEPREMTEEDIELVVSDFVNSAKLARDCGFRLLEVHAAHGRLVHSFISPISNNRSDHYGVNQEGRFRFPLRLAKAIRNAIGDEIVLGFRLSCVDWMPEGITIEDSIALSKLLRKEGVDFIDCSSGGIIRNLKKETASGYQVGFANDIKVRANIATCAVGEIISLIHANQIVESSQADIVMMGRRLMMDPFYPLRYAADNEHWELIPKSYKRAAYRLRQYDQEHIPEL